MLLLNEDELRRVSGREDARRRQRRVFSIGFLVISIGMLTMAWLDALGDYTPVRVVAVLGICFILSQIILWWPDHPLDAINQQAPDACPGGKEVCPFGDEIYDWNGQEPAELEWPDPDGGPPVGRPANCRQFINRG